VSEFLVVLVLLAAGIVMFAINKPRLDAVAMIMLTTLPFTGAFTMSEAMTGFSDPKDIHASPYPFAISWRWLPPLPS